MMFLKSLSLRDAQWNNCRLTDIKSMICFKITQEEGSGKRERSNDNHNY